MNTATNLINITDDLKAQGVAPKLTKLPSAATKKRRTARRVNTTKTTPTMVYNNTPASKVSMQDIQRKYRDQVKADRRAAAIDRQNNRY